MDKIQDHLSKYKWYDGACEMISLVDSGKASKGEIMDTLDSLILHTHPETKVCIAECVLKIFSTEESLEILKKTYDAIANYGHGSKDYLEQRTRLEMLLCMIKIRNGNLDGRETEILSWKSGKTPDYNEILLYRVSYMYYEAIGHVEGLQKNLARYIEVSRDTSEMELLVKASILSRNFYDFAALKSLEEFAEIENKDLLALFHELQSGDMKAIKKRQRLLKLIIGEIIEDEKVQKEYLEVVNEKVKLVCIINICYASKDKTVPLDSICKPLNLEKIQAISLILRAMGEGLIVGWVDSIEERLYYDSLMKRCPLAEKIPEMRQAYCNWRERLQTMIDKVEGK